MIELLYVLQVVEACRVGTSTPAWLKTFIDDVPLEYNAQIAYGNFDMNQLVASAKPRYTYRGSLVCTCSHM